MDRYEFYKSKYDVEIAKTTELNSSLNIPIAIIVAIGAAIYSFSFNFIYTEFNFNTYTFIISIFLSLSFLLVSGGYLTKVFSLTFNKESQYRYIGYSDELEGYYLRLKEYYSTQLEENEDAEFENFIINEFVINSGANERLNGIKNANLNLGKDFIVLSLFFLLISFVTFMINHFYHLKF